MADKRVRSANHRTKSGRHDANKHPNPVLSDRPRPIATKSPVCNAQNINSATTPSKPTIAKEASETSPGKKEFSSRNSLRTSQSWVDKQSASMNDQRQTSRFMNIPLCVPPTPERDQCRLDMDTDLTNMVPFETERNYDKQLCIVCDEPHDIKKYEQCSDLLLEALWSQIPDKDSVHMNVLKNLLDLWYKQDVLTDEEIYTRLAIIDDIGQMVRGIESTCDVRLFGSLATGTARKQSDINLELVHPNSNVFERKQNSKKSLHHKLEDPNACIGEQFNYHTLYYDMISNPGIILYNILTKINNYSRSDEQYPFELSSQLEDLNSSTPSVKLVHRATRIPIQITCFTKARYELGIILQKYLSFDPRAPILCIIVKHWANICQIDRPDRGKLSPEALIVLVIFFLQRTEPPILPILQHCFAKKNKKPQQDENGAAHRSQGPSRQDALGSFVEPNIDSNIDDDDTPSDVNEEEGVENEDEADEDLSEEWLKNFQNEMFNDFEWKSDNSESVHMLFIKFLKTMINEFEDLSTKISIVTAESPRLRVVPSKKFIASPRQFHEDLSQSVGQRFSFEYIKDCFERAYYCFSSLPVVISHDKIVPRTQQVSDGRKLTKFYYDEQKYRFCMRMNHKSGNKIAMLIRSDIFSRDVEILSTLARSATNSSFGPKHIHSLISELARIHANVNPRLLQSIRHAQSKQFCRACRMHGHIKEECPARVIENLDIYTEVYDAIDQDCIFDKEFVDMYTRSMITIKESRVHLKILEELQQILRSASIDCNLQLYGSTVNNLGTVDSDLDVCMTLNGNDSGSGIVQVKFLTNVNDILARVPEITCLQPILSAKVPIVKFEYKRFAVDLSMYNLTALYNSAMLKEYSLIDKRVPILIHLVKKFAKGCRIADASRGSLSSYAWSIMAIHYLQRTNPPVVPILQEAEWNQSKPRIGVSGWDVWFKKASEATPQNPRNEQSLTELLSGFFIYFATFDFSMHVITIRQRETMFKLQKCWNDCIMAIEDPFELTYNLSGRLDEPMALYIINTFVLAYRHMRRTQISCLDIPDKTRQANDLFRGPLINRNPPPMRGCRICHRFGHIARVCPDKKMLRARRPRYISRQIAQRKAIDRR